MRLIVTLGLRSVVYRRVSLSMGWPRGKATALTPICSLPMRANSLICAIRRSFPRFSGQICERSIPQVAQSWFYVSYLLASQSLAGLRFILLGHEVVTVTLLVILLRKLEYPITRSLVYAWSPLAIVQLFADAHLDGLALPWLLLALLLSDRRPFVSGIALALSAMVSPTNRALRAFLGISAIPSRRFSVGPRFLR